MKQLYFIILIVLVNYNGYSLDSTTFHEIYIYDSVDSLIFEKASNYKLDSIRLVADLELDEEGYLSLVILNLFNRLDQAVFLIIDDFILVDNISYSELNVPLSPFSSFIYLYNEEDKVKFSKDFKSPSTFPCYFEVGGKNKNTRWTFSIEFMDKKFRDVLKRTSRARIRFFYFLEEDIKKIEAKLGTTIKYSQIQSKNFRTIFLLDLKNRHINEFDVFDANSEKIESKLLEKVFKQYIKPIETDIKIYDLFK